MGHDAFFPVDVVSSLDEKVTAITHSSDSLYLGTASGRIVQFKLTPRTTAGGKTEYTSVKERTIDVGSTKSPVTQIEAAPDLQVLIALCDGCVSLHRLLNLDKIPSVLDSKNATGFSLNNKLRRLCIVSSKKRLRLYEWLDGKFAPSRGNPELDVPDVPRAMAYFGARIAVGYQREYNILVEETGEVRDVSATMSRDTKPLIKVLPEDAILLVCTGEMGIVLDAITGEPCKERPIVQFGHKATAVGYCYPYILSVCEGSPKVEVHSSRGGRDEIVQTITLPGSATAMTDSRLNGPAASALAEAEGGKGRNPVFVACSTGSASSKIVRLQPVPVDRQVADMLRQYQLQSATELLTNTCPQPEQLAEKLSRLNIDAGRSLFLGLHFEQAWPFLTASDVDPREILHMFPELLPGSTAPLPLQGGIPVGMNKHQAGGRGKTRTFTFAGIGSPSSGSSGATIVGGMYTPYPSRYFSVALTQGIATGTSQPQDAASEAADARGGDSAAAAAEGEVSLAELGLDDAGGGHPAKKGKGTGKDKEGAALAPTARIACADATSIILSQHAAYVKRMKAPDEDSSVGDTHVGLRVAKLVATGELELEGRLAAAYKGLMAFLRHRRSVLLHYQRHHASPAGGGTGGGAGGDSYEDENVYEDQEEEEVEDDWDRQEEGSYGAQRGKQGGPSSGARRTSAAGAAQTVEDQLAAAGLRLPAHCVQLQHGRKRFAAGGSTFNAAYAKRMSERELSSLLAVLDTALFKLFIALGRSAHADRLAFYPNRLIVADMSLFCRSAELSGSVRLHSLALLYAGRSGSGSKEALSIWRECGTGAAHEVVHAPFDWGSCVPPGSSKAKDSDDEEEEDGGDAGMEDALGGGGGGGGGGKGAAHHPSPHKHRRDSLSDFGDAMDAAERVLEDGLLSGEDEDLPAPHAQARGAQYGAVRGTGQDVTPLALALARTLTCMTGGSSKGATVLLYDGVPESIAFLRGLSEPASLIWDYSEWLLLKHPSRALGIFTAAHRGRGLKADAVLDYLSGQKFAEASRRNPGGSVVRLFLEHMVGNPSSRPSHGEERHHTRLAREYISTITALRSAGMDGSGKAALEGPVSERPAPGTEGGLLGTLRGRLVRVLQESHIYDAKALLALLKDSSLLEERVILHGKLGQHEAALSLLVDSLGDHPSAVRYCSAVAAVQGNALQGALGGTGQAAVNAGATAAALSKGSEESSSGAVASSPTDPFLVLLRIYLEAHRGAAQEEAAGRADAAKGAAASTAPVPSALNISAYLSSALDLLARHPEHVDAVEAMKVLPGELPARSLLSYARAVLPSSANAVREATLAKHLFNYSYIASHATLVQKQQRNVTIGRNSSCPVCAKRIGEAVFAVLPDGRPVHFYCQRDINPNGQRRQGPSKENAADSSSASAGMGAGVASRSVFDLYTVPGHGPLALQGIAAPVLARHGLAMGSTSATTNPFAVSGSGKPAAVRRGSGLGLGAGSGRVNPFATSAATAQGQGGDPEVSMNSFLDPVKAGKIRSGVILSHGGIIMRQVAGAVDTLPAPAKSDNIQGTDRSGKTLINLAAAEESYY